MTMSDELRDQAVVVTGGQGGIGRAVVQAVLARGGRVAVMDLGDGRPGESEAHDAERVLRLRVDVGIESDVDRAFDEAHSRFGDLVGLVNCAGVASRGRVDQTDLDRWNHVMRVNVIGPRNTCAAFVRLARADRGPSPIQRSIVNVASTAGTFADHDAAGYCASKGALIALTKALSVDHGREGIRANSVSPGWVDTAMSQGFLADESDQVASGTEAFAPPRLRTDIGRMGDPEEVATIAAFLLSSRSSFMTGSDVVADAGWSVGK